MRLATKRDGSRDGRLVVVDSTGTKYAMADGIATTLQAALDRWEEAEPRLRELAKKLDGGAVEGHAVDASDLSAPLPRAYEWIDGSAYINHIVLVRKARNAEPPATLETDPLVYQGGSGVLLGARDHVELADESWGCDYEAEICVILGDTPQGTKASEAAKYIKLVMICNDVSLRNLIPGELKKGFGFFTSKPATAFSSFAVTPDELGEAWSDGRLNLKMESWLNGEVSGDPDAGPEMHFSFHQLIEHICKTRSYTAGTILGSGTVSNVDESRGVSCLAERRMREIIETGEASTRFLQAGDQIKIQVCDESGRKIFGTIEQSVVAK
jgi:fumarylacetoacetate (FAA) hydrolase